MKVKWKKTCIYTYKMFLVLCMNIHLKFSYVMFENDGFDKNGCSKKHEIS